MVLSLKTFRGCSVVELAVAFTPVSGVSVVRRLISFDVGVAIFTVWYCWKSLSGKFYRRVAIHVLFFVEDLEGSVRCSP